MMECMLMRSLKGFMRTGVGEPWRGCRAEAGGEEGKGGCQRWRQRSRCQRTHASGSWLDGNADTDCKATSAHHGVHQLLAGIIPLVLQGREWGVAHQRDR